MRLTDASVTIRPRSAWEACALGVLLARRHIGLLTASWALLTLPVFMLCSALLWQQPGMAMFLFWWLKPLYERLPLHILSRALFGATPTLKQALQALPGLLKPQLLASLTWRRLSLTRSFDLPVLQLEGLTGQARSQRLIVLSQRDARPATWLTIIGSHIEMALWMGLLSLLYLLLPQQWELDWSWSNLIEPDSGSWLWLEHLSNLLYALVLIIWEPVYVACGFSLYLNRRSALEAWDIELAFRRLRQRLSGIGAVALLVFGLFLLPPTPSAWAAADNGPSNCPLPMPQAPGPEAARLLHQPLSSQAAQTAIKHLLEQPPFQHSESVTRWRFAEETSKKQDDAAKANSLKDALKRLIDFMAMMDGFKSLAQALEVLLWTSLFCLLLTLAWRYREWLRTFGARLQRPGKKSTVAPTQLFGLQVAPQSLPDDIAGSVEALWAEQPREALGLLYRALLSRLLHDHQLPLKSSHTEAEVLQLTLQLQQAELSRFAQVLTRHWQNLAYGHQLPPDNLKRGLCEGWRRLFNTQVSA